MQEFLDGRGGRRRPGDVDGQCVRRADGVPGRGLRVRENEVRRTRGAGLRSVSPLYLQAVPGRTFRSGAHGRLVAFIKAGLAALFIKREIRLAFAAAQNSPALCKLVVSPMRTVSETVQAAVSKLKHGDASGVGSVETAISQVESQAPSQGANIVENASAPLS